MKRNLKLLVTLFAVTSLSSCAGHRLAEQKIEQEIKEVSIEKNVSIGSTARDTIMKSDKLTEVQKNSLMELETKTHALNVALKEQIEKTKIVLIQTVLEPKMNQKEYSILKKKIVALEKKKMENGFKAITEARNIIEPKMNVENREMIKAYMFNHLQEN